MYFVTVICQFCWFTWYNVIIADVTAFVAAIILFTVFLYASRRLGWFLPYLFLGAALIAALLNTSDRCS